MEIQYPNELFNEEELKNTPNRHKRFIEEWQKKCEDFNFTVFPSRGYKGMIMMKNISFASLCAHHLLPFEGVAHIAYIPEGKICGASKLIRSLELFASRPNTQEQLTYNLIEYLDAKLKPKGLMIVLKANHACIRIRGVKNSTSEFITSEVRGVFLHHELGKEPKMEFLAFLQS